MLAKCECGECDVLASVSALIAGTKKSCGCLHRESARARGLANKTHGESRKTRLYSIWSGMKSRCEYPSDASYGRYGGAGIKLCDEWSKSYPAFRDWSIQNGYQDGLTIDRINPGDYRPDNCRWVDIVTQNNNRPSFNRLVLAFGESKTVSEWSRDHRCCVSDRVLRSRLCLSKWEAETAITKPSTKKKQAG